MSWIEYIGSVLDSMSFLACSLQCAQMAILFSVCHRDHSITILLPQQVEFLSNWLPYSNTQIGFILSWIESIGSVWDSMSFLACSLQCAQMAILFSVCHKDHSCTILLPNGYYKYVIGYCIQIYKYVSN